MNSMMGYRSFMSVKNEDTWQFAHKCLSRIWKKYGLIMLVVSAIIGLLVIGKSDETVGKVIGGTVLVQTAAILISIYQ